ncbi:hypothetical protein TWF730_004468 [Orbilia blumenaviensis]|uniref:Uncharacterized protein n=1 Tax=Orbilia blumenaviensis TaxID=1796055 RepID=A0AAV9TYI9_9PEZI
MLFHQTFFSGIITMPRTRKNPADPEEQVTPSPPSAPTTPTSQKPAFIAAHTPTSFNMRSLRIASTPARQASQSLRAGLTSASGTKKLGKTRLSNSEAVSPTQAAVDRRKRPRLSSGEDQKPKEGKNKMSVPSEASRKRKRVGGGAGTFSVEVLNSSIAVVEGISDDISPLKLDSSEPGFSVEILQAPKASETQQEGQGGKPANDNDSLPSTPPPRRRGRPPKKATNASASGSSDEAKMAKPEHNITKGKKRAAQPEKPAGSGEEEVQPSPSNSAETTRLPVPDSPETHSPSETDLTKKLHALGKPGVQPEDVRDELAKLFETFSSDELAEALVHLQGPIKVRREILMCVITALRGKDASEVDPNAESHQHAMD